jgi:hypothetical protein
MTELKQDEWTQTLVNSLRASKGWTTAYAEAFVAASQPAQAGQEPVAWAVYWGIGQMRRNSVHFERVTAEKFAGEIKSVTEIRPLYAAPQPAQAEQEPVAWRYPKAGIHWDLRYWLDRPNEGHREGEEPLYTAPQPAQAVKP